MRALTARAATGRARATGESPALKLAIQWLACASSGGPGDSALSLPFRARDVAARYQRARLTGCAGERHGAAARLSDPLYLSRR